jgi:hypothetical protein
MFQATHLIDVVLIFACDATMQRTTGARCPQLLEDIVEAVLLYLSHVTFLYRADGLWCFV